MLDERKAAILRAVVEEYIDTAQPVGSGHIVRAPGVNVSSATVRNELVQLEHDGFLQQPHTSAGRVPTDKGYRFFVDHLLDPGPLDAASRQQVRGFFAQAHGAIEQMLQDTTRLLSDLTDYAAVVVGPDHEDATIRSVQLVGLNPSTAMLVGVLSNGVVEKSVIELGDDTGEERLAAATAHLSAHLVGTTLRHLPPLPATGDPSVDAVAVAALDALQTSHQDEPGDIYLGGASRVASAFDAVESVRQVLGVLEEQYVVVGLVRDVLDRGLRVSIGSEHEPLSECSIVVAPYEVDGELAGSIGVLGPTRMNYPQALAAVAVVSHRLGHRLTEG